MKLSIIYISLFLIFGISCRSGHQLSEDLNTENRTPVTITHPSVGELSDVIALNATSSFLLKTYVKATSNGYLQEVDIKLGDNIVKGQKLFLIRTKEAEYLGNTINEVDSSFRFSGLNQINSPVSGYVTQLTLLAGNYVQDGETLAEISDKNSLVFLLDLPYELKPYLGYNNKVDLLLPDGQELTGSLTKSLPLVDQASQTQTYIIKVSDDVSIPENLIARVTYIKKVIPRAVTLPKEAVLTNEIQSEFWIMKMTDSTTAIKVDIQKGIESDNKVEIVAPVLLPTDNILLTGNFGLPDTARVIIENQVK